MLYVAAKHETVKNIKQHWFGKWTDKGTLLSWKEQQQQLILESSKEPCTGEVLVHFTFLSSHHSCSSGEQWTFLAQHALGQQLWTHTVSRGSKVQYLTSQSCLCCLLQMLEEVPNRYTHFWAYTYKMYSENSRRWLAKLRSPR